MIRRFAAYAAAIAFAAVPSSPTPAGCRVAVATSSVASSAVVVPFAVPVAVPVTTVAATPAGFAYTAAAAPYSTPQAAAFRTAEDDLVDRIVARLAARLGGGPSAASSTLSLRHCGRCHTGESAKGSFRVDVPLDDAGRLRAIAAVLADDESQRMPKGSTLSADDLGPLIQEFSRRPIAAQDADDDAASR